ncbi:hypothetical protein GOODEAATRI_019474 [Goodea atripinnis]|uniref:Uncharacterized protein n=1 Tax=Goodea atripinnis TaxID=208336 RepID=A0ABV0NVX6_9TELE
MPEIPRVLFRDELRSSGGKQPISFPPHPKQTSSSSQLANGDGSAKHSLKERRMPLVLPTLPVKDPKMDASARKEHKLESERGKEVFPHSKMKKKGLLLPFKSVKASKNSADNGEELTCGDLTNRPYSAPSEFCPMEKQGTEEQASPQSNQSISEYLVSNPEFTVTPPPPETFSDSDNRILSTLENAKKKFSRRQIIGPTKPKGLCSPDYSCREKTFPLSPKNPDSLGSDVLVPPPVCLPHLACISARPFFKANSSVHKLETADNEPVDIAAIETEALDIFVGNPTRPVICEVTDYHAPDSALSVCDPTEPSRSQVVQDLNLGSPHIIPLDPASFPEPINLSKFPELPLPERWSNSEEAAVDAFPNSRSEETDVGAADSLSVTGEEEPMYHAKVTVASKVRKNDLPVKNGDTVSIIRTTNCPKGKWLARDANHKCRFNCDGCVFLLF